MAAASVSPSIRWEAIRPPIWSNFCPPFNCAARPTHWKIEALTSVCRVRCSTPAKIAALPPRPKAKAATPLCSMVEKAKNRLASRRGHRLKAASSSDSSPSAMIGGPGSIASELPAISWRSRRITTSATFRMDPASTAETGVGPSAWASGIQACSGARAALVP